MSLVSLDVADNHGEWGGGHPLGHLRASGQAPELPVPSPLFTWRLQPVGRGTDPAPVWLYPGTNEDTIHRPVCVLGRVHPLLGQQPAQVKGAWPRAVGLGTCSLLERLRPQVGARSRAHQWQP